MPIGFTRGCEIMKAGKKQVPQGFLGFAGLREILEWGE